VVADDARRGVIVLTAMTPVVTAAVGAAINLRDRRVMGHLLWVDHFPDHRGCADVGTQPERATGHDKLVRLGVARHGQGGRQGRSGETYCAHVAGMRVCTVVAQIHWISWLTFIPHSRIVRSRLPVARVRASGLNTTA
jgi:hypothetical protein